MKITDNRGYTFVEITVTLAIMVILGLVISQVIVDLSKNSQLSQLAATRDQVAISTRMMAGNIQALKNTLKQPGNEAFYQCVCGTGICNATTPTTIKLYDNNNVLANSAPIPNFYNSAGLPCDGTATNCYLTVTTNFVAQCLPVLPSSFPSPLASCSGKAAEFFGIIFKVSQNGASMGSSGNFLNPNAGGTLLKPVGGIVFTQVSTFNSTTNPVCP